MMTSSDDRSAAARTSSGSLSIRLNMVGTTCECVTRYRPTSSRYSAGSKCSITTAVDFIRRAMATLTCGAVWYSGAGDRYTMPSRSRHNPAIPSTPMLVSDGWRSNMGRRMPLGRPVVPDEYIMGAPICSSGTWSVGCVATESSQDSNLPPMPHAPSVSTMIQRSTSGQRAGSCRATSAFAVEVMTIRDCESLMT